MSDSRHTDDVASPAITNIHDQTAPSLSSSSSSTTHGRDSSGRALVPQFFVDAIREENYTTARIQRQLRSILQTRTSSYPMTQSSPSDSNTIPSFTPIQPERYQSLSSSELDEELRRRDLARRRHLLEYTRDHYGRPDERDAKKRKIDDSTTGQVGRAKLPLELLYDDGGLYQRRSHPVQNLLRDDKSVYCSRKSTCNLLLQHQSKNYFSVQKLIIKAPGDGYTSPVSEGMVFLFNEIPIRDILDNTKDHTPEHRQDTPGEDDDDDPETNIETEDENDSDYTPPLPPYDCPYEISDTRAADFVDDEELERDSVELMSLQAAAGAAGISLLDALSTRRPRQSINTEMVVVSGDPISNSRDNGDGETLLTPHAKFYIPSGSSRSTIVFSPPLYCRFIMIKLWAAKASQNIDIESISAYGYYGRRFFPAARFR